MAIIIIIITLRTHKKSPFSLKRRMMACTSWGRQYVLEHCCRLVLEPTLNLPPTRWGTEKDSNYNWHYSCSVSRCSLLQITVVKSSVAWLLVLCMKQSKRFLVLDFPVILSSASGLPSIRFTISLNTSQINHDKHASLCLFILYSEKMKHLWKVYVDRCWIVFAIRTIFGVTWRSPRDDNNALLLCSGCCLLLQHKKYPSLLYGRFYLAIRPILLRANRLGQILFGVVHVQRPTACERVLCCILT
jgi:hypothetical protein